MHAAAGFISSRRVQFNSYAGSFKANFSMNGLSVNIRLSCNRRTIFIVEIIYYYHYDNFKAHLSAIEFHNK